MEASPELHTIGYIRWLAAITVRHPDDWQILLPYRHLVRQLRCADGVLTGIRHQTVLERFNHLYTLSIDAHSDVIHDEQHHFAYRDLFLSLPASLRHLEITRAHGPDIKIIAAVKQCCPNLEILSLGRCTVFNSPMICRFWQTFPLDHDSYMSIEDTDSYAVCIPFDCSQCRVDMVLSLQHSLAQELAPLQCLRSLRLGLYLIPSTTILAHRLYHKRNVAAPEHIEWQHAIPLASLPADVVLDDAAQLNLTPASTDQLSSILYQTDPREEFGPESTCGFCVESLSQIGDDAETRANAILKNLLPNLTSVQWMAWFSPDHLGVNVHEL
ncbi:hypothetical protein FRC08_005443 [Ceratobasidium sp. 394]|nr:hypothetical protein FRC08_005443 [Ceratobasidium sp. 394]